VEKTKSIFSHLPPSRGRVRVGGMLFGLIKISEMEVVHINTDQIESVRVSARVGKK
jgi:hypothetical protein